MRWVSFGTSLKFFSYSQLIDTESFTRWLVGSQGSESNVLPSPLLLSAKCSIEFYWSNLDLCRDNLLLYYYSNSTHRLTKYYSNVPAVNVKATTKITLYELPVTKNNEHFVNVILKIYSVPFYPLLLFIAYGSVMDDRVPLIITINVPN